ncbi:MAG: hypothetical protein AAF567_06125 [Actinomycetota bacterium]
MTFDAPLTIAGPFRAPMQMLEDQTYDGQMSVHDDATADTLGLTGAPIEGPTHFSQFDPIAHRLWGDDWFSSGCISAHFTTMVVEGEQVQASVSHDGGHRAEITATKEDGSTVLTGSMSVAPHGETALEARMAAARTPGDLFIIDQLTVGLRMEEDHPALVDATTPNGNLYPFSLARKLDGITERSPYYDSPDNPWGRPILPMEMLSVLAHKIGERLPIRRPSVGLFLDLEVRTEGTPVFVGEPYRVDREIVAISESRRVESYWTRTTLTEESSGRHCATVLLHSGVFKESYPGYPQDRLG